MNKKITISLAACLILSTNIYANELSSVKIISATKSLQSIKDVTSNISVITKEEIEFRNYTSVSEALNTISGIDVVSNGGLGKTTSVFLRGFDSQRILVLIDGIRYNNVTSISGAAFSHLMISDIERIEVVKGAQSGIWGADANAGVINIITKEARNGLISSFDTEYGSFNTKKGSIKVSNKTKDYLISAHYSKIKTNGFTSKAKRFDNINDLEDDAYENETANLKFSYKINDDNQITLNHNIIKTKSEYDSSFTDTEGYEIITNDSFSQVSFVNKNNKFTNNAYVNYTKFDKDDEKGWTKEFDGNLKEYGFNTKIDYLEKSFIILGSDLKESTHKNSLEKTLKNKSVFFTNSSNFKTNTVLTQSLRYDKYDLFSNKTTGKIGFKHNFNKEVYISSNYGTSYNVPTFYKLYDSYNGYEDLQAESTKSFDASVKYKNVKLTYFYNKIKNMIEYNKSISKYYNAYGDSKFKGLELEYNKSITQNILFKMNYTRLIAKDNNSKDLERRTKDSAKFSIDYYGIKKTHFNLNAYYVGKRVEYTYGTYDVKAQTGKYTVLNAVVNYDINRTFKTYLKIDNVGNKYYQSVDGYATSPRAYYIGLKAKF